MQTTEAKFFLPEPDMNNTVHDRVHDRIIELLGKSPDVTLTWLGPRMYPVHPKWRTVLENLIIAKVVVREAVPHATPSGRTSMRLVHRLAQPAAFGYTYTPPLAQAV